MDWKKVLADMQAKMKVLLDKAKAENRAFTADEQKEFDGYIAKAEEAQRMIKAEDAIPANQPQANATQTPKPDAATVQKIMAVQKSLRATAKSLNVNNEEIVTGILDKVLNGEISESDAKDQIIAEHQKQMKPAGGSRVDVDIEDADKYRAAASIVMARAGNLPLSKEEQAELPKTGMGTMGLQDFCRDVLARAGVRNAHQLSGDALYAAMCNRPRGAISQGSDDFAAVLENVLNKSLSSGWTETASTWDIVCGRESVNDFRAHNMIAMSAFSDVEEIPEGAGFTYGRMTDKKESVTVKTYGKAWSCTRQMIVNDDMGAFVQVPRLMGGASKRKIETVWIDLLTSVSFAGPTMTETTRAFFNTTDGNYLSSGGAAPSVTTIGAGSLAMQTRPILKSDDKKSADIPSGVTPKIILVPTAIEVVTMQVVRSVADPASTTGAGQVYNPYNYLTPISSAQLNAKSTTRWYLFADPRMYPAFVVAFLKGVETPTARTREGSVGEPLGFIHDIYHDFAVAAREWRYAYQSKGAA